MQASFKKRRKNNCTELKPRKHRTKASHRVAFLVTISPCPKPCTRKTFPISCPKFVAGVHGQDMLDMVATQLSSPPSIRQVNLQCKKRNSSKNRPQLQRMMLITLNIVCMNIVCMSWSKICNAFGVTHVGNTSLLSCTHVILICCLLVKCGVGKRMGQSSRKKVSTSFSAVVRFVKVLEIAFRRILFHILFIFFSCIFQSICNLHFSMASMASMASRRLRLLSNGLECGWRSGTNV